MKDPRSSWPTVPVYLSPPVRFADIEARPHSIEMGTPDFVGTQRMLLFPNGYGASIVQFRSPYGGGSYGVEQGLYELAVIKASDTGDWDLTYETPIADDVIGWLSEDDILDLLQRIADLPAVDLTNSA